MVVTNASELQQLIYLQFTANESLLIDFYCNGYRFATLVTLVNAVVYVKSAIAFNLKQFKQCKFGLIEKI